MKSKIQYGTISIPYHIIKSKRVKTSEIIVDADKVTIRTPLNKDLSEIRGIVSNKAQWLYVQTMNPVCIFGHQINKEQLKDPFFAAIK
jgi:predicted metal-dependent hydrolase